MVAHETGHPPPTRGVEELERVGGRLALDFANTVGGTRERPNEYLTDYARLVRWAELTGAVDAGVRRRLLRRAEERPAEAGAALERALDLREAIYRIFAAIARGEAAPGADLERLNESLPSALARLRVAGGRDGYGWRWERDDAAVEQVLWPIARDAAELLVGGDLDRIKACGGEGCSWLFLDASRNRSRRWCDMADCGNRAKARRHYRRVRSARRG